jgi:hypothetical protein
MSCKNINNVKKSIENYGLELNTDFKITTTVTKQNKTKKEIYLTGYAFKRCLMESRNNDNYRKYFMFVDTVFHRYNEYKREWDKNIINFKDDKIDRMEKLLQENNIICKDMNSNIKEMNQKITKIHDVAMNVSHRSIPNSRKKSDHPGFVLLKNNKNEHKFKLVRGQNRHTISKSREMTSNGDYTILLREYTVNPIIFSKHVKELFDDYHKEVIHDLDVNEWFIDMKNNEIETGKYVEEWIVIEIFEQARELSFEEIKTVSLN